jgi:hypothetical protein
MRKSEIRTLVREEFNTYLTETLAKRDFIEMAREIRQAPSQYRTVLMAFAIKLAKGQNPRFDEDRFKAAVETGKGI